MEISMKKIVAAFFLFSVLISCATKQTVFHSFSFNAIDESPGVEILDWRYGQSKQPGAHATRTPTSQGTGITADMLVPDFLYVKWIIKATGKVHEKTVNMTGLNSARLKNNEIHFVVINEQLHVYLVTNELRPRDWPIYPAIYSKYYKTYQIYPNGTGN
jgi:hypothetical protein